MTDPRIAKLRTLAVSVLAAVQGLEDLKPHSSWEGQGDRINAYLDDALEELRGADATLNATVDDFLAVFVP